MCTCYKYMYKLKCVFYNLKFSKYVNISTYLYIFVFPYVILIITNL